jgi:putative heme iron utilization protein
MIVGRQLREGATAPQAAVAAMADAQPIVPGSQPTTFQQTGDMGLGAMERGAAARDPAAFNTRRADQNTARMNAFESVQPTGAPEQVAQTVRARMAEIDQQTQAAIDAATQEARSSTAAIGPGRTPEVAGDAVRQSIETARAAAKTRERALWTAVDPDGTLALQANQTRGQLADTLMNLPASAKRPEGEEAAIYNVIRSYGDVVPFSEMTALQSRLKTAMRTERLDNGESAAYRRLSQLNTSLENDLEAAIVGKVQQQEQAVARGEMDAMDTIAAKLQQEARSFLDARQAATGEVSRTGTVGNATGAPRAFSGANGAEVPGSGRFAGSQGDTGLPSDGLVPNFNAEALGRLRTARGATKTRAETFDNATLAPIRKRPATTSPYDMPASAVPAKLFFPGAKSFDAINTYRAAVGDGAALTALRDYAVDRLRRVAMREDGTLDPAKLASWRRSHADALRAFPALDQQLANAGRVSEAMATVAAARRVAIDEAQQGAIAKLLRVEDPQDVTRVVGSLFGRADSVAQMMRLRSAIGDNAEALEGLRKAVADYMIDRFVSNTESGTTGLGTLKADQFQTFIAQNKAALGVAGFKQQELELFDNIAADLQQANRSITAVKLPGGSNTTQDVLAAKANDSPSITIAKAIAAASGTAGTAGFVAGGPIAAGAASIGGAIFAVLRQNGISKIDELLRDALLDPKLARTLMIKATPANAKIASITLRQRLARAVLAGQAATLN